MPPKTRAVSPSTDVPAASQRQMSSASARLSVPSGGMYSTANSAAHHASHAHLSSSITPHQYLARMLDFGQMDFQSALDQMKTLLTLQPQRVYKTAYYRKQTKNHWARDDPGFAALQVAFLTVASLAWCVAFKASLITSTLSFALKSILINWLLIGVVVASAGRALANSHLIVHPSGAHVRQRVEWLYAFDIHCNAFFPLFVLIYCVQFFLLPLVLGKSLLALMVSNSLFAFAFGWYFYVTHLGYRGEWAGFGGFIWSLGSIHILCVPLIVMCASNEPPYQICLILNFALLCSSSLPVKNWGVPLPHCWRLTCVRAQPYFLSLWFWMERIKGYGLHVLRVRKGWVRWSCLYPMTVKEILSVIEVDFGRDWIQWTIVKGNSIFHSLPQDTAKRNAEIQKWSKQRHRVGGTKSPQHHGEIFFALNF